MRQEGIKGNAIFEEESMSKSILIWPFSPNGRYGRSEMEKCLMQ